MEPDRILDLFPPPPRTLHFRELSRRLDTARPDRPALWDALGRMVEDGLLERHQGSHYGRPLGPSTTVGTLTVNPRGFGFVAREDEGDDLYVDARDLGGAHHRDRVKVRVIAGRRGRLAAEVIEVLDRGTHTFVATLRESRAGRWLVPRDARLPDIVQIDGPVDARDGDLVAAAFESWPDQSEAGAEPANARVIKVFGREGQAARETDMAVYDLGLRVEFPDEVEAAAAAFGDVIDPAEVERRRDLRGLPLLTIDPDSARDFDDAVHAAPLPGGGWRMTVAVADVAHYVRPGEPLDVEARARSFSVYLPDRVLPMLPHPLSSGLCSLRPDEERLAMVTEFDVAPDGTRGPASCSEAVILSHGRLTYDEAAAMLGLSGRPPRPGRPEHEPLRPVLEALVEATRALRAMRRRRGRLDLDTAEPKVRFAPDGSVAGITTYSRHEAHRLVEEAMVATNEAIAQQFVDAEHPAVFRVHDDPSEEGLTRFAAHAELLGAHLPEGADETLRSLDRWLERLDDHPRKPLLHMLLLRAMARAEYRAECTPHYGLGAPAYLHFTSPIRRYPDLAVHRLVKAALAGRAGQTLGELAGVARETTRQERVTVEAEREVMALYKALAMQHHVGEVCEGFVMGLSESGIFVQLEQHHVEGMVRFDKPGGPRFRLTRDGMTLVEPRSGEKFTLGDTVRVRIHDVSLRERRIELALARPPARLARKAPRKGKSGRGGRARTFRPGRRRR